MRNTLASLVVVALAGFLLLGVGTEILPGAAFVDQGDDITVNNNTDSGVSVKITNITTSTLVHSAVIAGGASTSYTVVDDVGDELRTEVFRDSPQPVNSANHTVTN